MSGSQDHNEYSIILAATGFPALLREAYRVADLLRADGTPQQANLVIRAIGELKSKLLKIAAETAVTARTSIRDYEAATRVRPDTHGGGGPRLGDFVGVSSPLDAVPGSVGINHEPTLENAGVEWWPALELGTRANIGRKFIGAFDGTRPDRQYGRPNPPGGPHALLEMGRGVRNRGKGTIRRPIPARQFVQKGAAAVEVRWHMKVRAAEDAFVADVMLAKTPAPRLRP